MYYARVEDELSMNIEKFPTKKERDEFVEDIVEKYGIYYQLTYEENLEYSKYMNRLRNYDEEERENMIDYYVNLRKVKNTTYARAISAKEAKSRYKEYL